MRDAGSAGAKAARGGPYRKLLFQPPPGQPDGELGRGGPALGFHFKHLRPQEHQEQVGTAEP